ncbi:MAG: protoporphyrinogen oxidase [Rhodospirillales bacterium]|nr:protoporphyrinogen oxidase [Rhodospirillales bacterium]
MVVIVGGGISGLSTAWFLRRRGRAVRVLESRDRVGGLIATDRSDGFVVERGPNSTLQKAGTSDDALGRLVAEAGLGDRLVEAGEAGRKRYILRAGQLRALPTSPIAFLTTKLFSWRAKLRLLREPFIRPGASEESIARFAERRLGREFLDYAVRPFISGVYAGDATALSVRAAVPRIYELEQTYGSLIRGAVALGKVAKGAGTPAGRMISFDRGMASLPEAIAGALPEGACRTGCEAVALRRTAEGWDVHWRTTAGSGVEHARTVVLALPASEAANLLEPLSAEAAQIIRSIPYAPVASVALGYDRDQVRHPLDGFGFLTPRNEDVRLLGGLFSSSLFAQRAPPGKVLITAFIGGSTDPGAAALADEELLGRVGDDLARVLGIAGAPGFVRIARHARAIPQYTLGHLERLAQVDRAVQGLPGLVLRASWRGGISVADCIRNGEGCARQITEDSAPEG